MIRNAEPRLIRKLIEIGLEGNYHAIIYLLDHIQRVGQIKLTDVQCVEDGVENLRLLLNAFSTGQIPGKEAKAVAGQLAAFVKAAIALDAKVGLAALKRQMAEHDKMLIHLLNLLGEPGKDRKKGK
jgi:hypothetical protein